MHNGNGLGSTNPQNDDSNDRMARMELMMNNLVGVVQNLQQHVLPPPPPPPAGMGPPPPPPPPPPEIPLPVGQGDEPNVKEFLKMGPPTFIGGMDPRTVKSWFSALEKIFKVMRCRDHQKVFLTVYQLQGEPERWWEMNEPTNQAVSWAEFLVLFKEKYIPQSILDAKSTEFQQLKQRGFMTVTAYEAEFTNLAEYAPHMIPDDNKKSRKFEDGLWDDIKKVVKPMKLPHYADVVDRSLMVEQQLADTRRYIENRKRENNNNNGGARNNGGNNKRQSTGNSGSNNRGGNYSGNQQQTAPKCPTCGRNHNGQCRMVTLICFGCGQPGHYKSECPKVATGANAIPVNKTTGALGSGNANNKGKGKAFALVPGDPRNNDRVVAGIMILCSLPAHVLLDSGSSHSFVSASFATKLPLKPEPLELELLVSKPMSTGILCTTVFRDCDICFDGLCLSVDLIPLEMGHFDVILGMDWLSVNNASIDCANKRIVFQTPERVFYFSAFSDVGGADPYLFRPSLTPTSSDEYSSCCSAVISAISSHFRQHPVPVPLFRRHPALLRRRQVSPEVRRTTYGPLHHSPMAGLTF
ncbi:hypothetical protein RHGRI_011757 [Rhododendron griersonianum]|uniref:CCHC-type domain-containing protein n=1 Tax=Rhododendron griersonianum TaxID=479676 RepID=A0AAV6KP91_9ERIC|nr:hypothetical protein RHGRI_011757 [Rhododendron griersonianum]